MAGRGTALVALALICVGATPAAACRLALVLALDVSASVDTREDTLQRHGLAAALRAPEVAAAFFAAPSPVALHVFEWSGRFDQSTLVDWTMIDTPADLSRVAAGIDSSLRSRHDMPTAMGFALGHAAGVLAQGPDCTYRTVDLSGDGVSNEGFGPQTAYGVFPFSGVTVNGLVVEGGAAEDVVAYYGAEVLRGPGAFLEVARGFDDFTRAMRRKLVREVSPLVLGQTDRRPD